MFYLDGLGSDLRLGDVIKGFVCSTPRVSKPLFGSDQRDYQLDISSSEYCVILSPCCSIGPNVASIAPLKEVPKNVFLNPYFANDLTNINRIAPADKALTPDQWANLPSVNRRPM